MSLRAELSSVLVMVNSSVTVSPAPIGSSVKSFSRIGNGTTNSRSPATLLSTSSVGSESSVPVAGPAVLGCASSSASVGIATSMAIVQVPSGGSVPSSYTKSPVGNAEVAMPPQVLADAPIASSPLSVASRSSLNAISSIPWSRL